MSAFALASHCSSQREPPTNVTQNSPAPNTPTTHVNVFDVPDAVDAPSPVVPEPLSPVHPPPPPALTPRPRRVSRRG
ncbi:unnamed protein product [Aureobasidium uvarum]|uniref:Uncharacterized protein n=1 Tax=Aureobasidium uvarum TaxID=2773716 RepID=A0A9N8KQ16_9PEZI|nr:unnamed protein product [Aureobasidium uvarum]